MNNFYLVIAFVFIGVLSMSFVSGENPVEMAEMSEYITGTLDASPISLMETENLKVQEIQKKASSCAASVERKRQNWLACVNIWINNPTPANLQGVNSTYCKYIAAHNACYGGNSVC